MTEKFPDLQGGQVTLLRADINTGIVLDENFKRAISSDQKVFSIFNDIEKAIGIAKLIINDRNDIECNLYGMDEKFLQRITYEDL